MIRRRFVDRPRGQLHLREAQGPGGRPPLVILHQASGSSRTMEPLMRAFCATRHVLAPDLPGNGDSTPLERANPTMDDYAAALLPWLDAVGGPVDLYGFHAGASVALEIALVRPARVRRLVLDSLGLYSSDEAAAMARDYVPVFARDRHGTHLLQAWHYVRDTYLFWPWFKQDAAHARAVGVPEPAALHDKVVEVLKALDSFGDLYRAAFAHDKEARLTLLRVKTLVTSGGTNSQARHVEAVAALVPGADRLVTAGIYDGVSTASTARAISAWLDA